MAIPQLDSNLLDFIELLNEKSVKYLLIGGYAVASHGFIRATKDIDFWFARTSENCLKLEQVTREFGVKTFYEAELLEPDMIFQLGYPPVRIDLINTPIPEDQLSFEICFARALDMEVESIYVKTVSLNDLITLKQHSARPRDLEDIRRLGMK